MAAVGRSGGRMLAVLVSGAGVAAACGGGGEIMELFEAHRGMPVNVIGWPRLANHGAVSL